MKNIDCLFAKSMVLLFAVALLWACSKEESESQLEKNYVTIENSKYVDGNMPSGASNVASFTINQYVLAGGSSILKIYSQEQISTLYIGVADQPGYLSVTPTFIGSSNGVYEYMVILFLSQNVGASFSFTVTAKLATGSVTSIWSKPVEYIPAGTGALQISLSFDTSKDLDLYVVEPDGNIVYWGRPSVGSSTDKCGLDLDSNANCDLDNKNNENIFYVKDCIQSGKYQVWVNLYRNCDVSVPTNWVITAIYNGKMIDASFGSNPSSGTFAADKSSNIIYTDLTNATKVMEFTINSGSSSSNVIRKHDGRIFEKGEMNVDLINW